MSTYKWDRLLRALGIHASRWMLLKLYTIGQFVGSFMPGIVGGDVVRWHMAGKSAGGRLKVAATIFAERVTGIVALTLLCGLAVLWDIERFATPPVLAGIGVVAAAVVGGLLLALNRRLAVTVTTRTRHTRLRRVVRPLHKLHRTLRAFPRGPLLGALADSCVFYLSCGLVFYMVCKAFGAPITFVEATIVQLLICMLTLLPVTIGGLGLVQVGDVYLLGLYGVDAPTALGASVIRLLIYYGYSVIGGVLFVRWKDRPAAAAS